MSDLRGWIIYSWIALDRDVRRLRPPLLTQANALRPFFA